jgi:hypothetical protein
LYVGGNDGILKQISLLGMGETLVVTCVCFVTQRFSTDGSSELLWADGTLPTLNAQTWCMPTILEGTFLEHLSH